MVGPRLHGNAVKGTNINAEFASRAGFGVDFGLGYGEGFDLRHGFSLGIDDGFHRTIDSADAAIDTEGRINMEDGFLFAGNSFGGTFDRAERAADAIVENDVGHGEILLNIWGEASEPQMSLPPLASSFSFPRK